MSNPRLGLPLEYKKLPEYFDAHNIGDDTEAKNQVIETLLRQHQIQTVLDLTCGTGSQVFFLTERGYTVTGADFSPALLEIAREKARQKQLDLRFIDGDMRTLQVGQFDAVITIFNAIGHLTRTGFAKALRNIRRNLKEGGIYVFDILNFDAMTEPTVAGLAMDTRKMVGDTEIHNVQYSTFDKATGRLTSHDHTTIRKGTGRPKTYKAHFFPTDL